MSKNLEHELQPSDNADIKISQDNIELPKHDFDRNESDSTMSHSINSQTQVLSKIDENNNKISKKKKKIKINPLKLTFILIIVIAAFTILILEQFVKPFKDAFELLNQRITTFLLTHPGISFIIWVGVLIGKGLGVKDFLELKRASLISFIAAPFNRNVKYAALIAFIAHSLTAVMDTIAAVFEFKFIGVEAQSVNTTLVEWVIIIFWNVIYFIFIFPFKYCFEKCCNKQLCTSVEPLHRQRSTIVTDNRTPNNDVENDNNNSNDTDNNNSDNNNNNNENSCCYSFLEYMKYDNSAFKLVGKTNLEHELSITQFLKLSPYCLVNHEIGVYPFAIIMLVFNGLSAFADAVFFLFNWRFGKKSLGIIAGYNFFDIESYFKTYVFTLIFLDPEQGFKEAVKINSVINIVGKIIGILFTYLINVMICKPIVKAHPKMYDKTKGIGFEIGAINEQNNDENDDDNNKSIELQDNNKQR